MSKILVTGANGQLGSEMRKLALISRMNTFIFTDIEELDITNLGAIRLLVQREEIELIVNCAAYTNVDKAQDDCEMADLINNKAVANLARVCKEANATLIHVSTDYVFPGDKNTPCREDEPTNPFGVYGQTKLAGEQSVLRSNCRYIILRTAWLYSAFGKNFVKTMMQLTAEREKLSVVFDQVGTPTYAGDLASLIFDIVERKLYNKFSGVYHYSNEGVCSWYDFATEIAAFSGNNSCDIQPCHSDEFPTKVKRPAFSVLDKTKVKADFNCNIPHWKVSLHKCLEELLA